MKRILVVSSLLLVTGCANFSNTAFRAEKIAADTAYGALHSWVIYYKNATNGAPSEEIQKLNERAIQFNELSRKVGTTLATTESLRAQYSTNQTIKPILQNSLEALTSQSSNIAHLVSTFINK